METCNHNLAAPPCQVQKPIQVSRCPAKTPCPSECAGPPRWQWWLRRGPHSVLRFRRPESEPRSARAPFGSPSRVIQC